MLTGDVRTPRWLHNLGGFLSRFAAFGMTKALIKY